MRIESCYISGFGRLKDLEYVFSDGLNVIVEDNGWGKTTLCAFIKAMFYGLEYSRKRLSLTERKHYEPWDKGTYGGNLVFSANGHRYRIERTFGAKEAEDTFALYDADSGLVSLDYSEAVGEELFEVDRESFEKSIFMPQDALETTMTDSLNAKMGNLSSVQDDINRFDDAIKRVEEEKKKYLSKGSQNPGLLTVIRGRIRSAKEQSEKHASLASAFAAKSALLDEKRAEYAKLYETKNELAEKIAYQSKKEQETGAYRQMQKARQQALAEQEQLDDFFANGVPEASEIEAEEDKERLFTLGQDRLSQIKKRIPMDSEIARLTALFGEHPLTLEQLTSWQDALDRIKELRAFLEAHRMPEADRDKLQELKFFFRERQPQGDEIGEAEEAATRLTQIDGQLETLEEHCKEAESALKSEEESRPRHGVFTGLPLYLSIALFAGGVVNLLWVGREPADMILTLGCIGFAAVLAVLYAVLMLRRRSQHKKKLALLDGALSEATARLSAKKEERDRVSGVCRDFLSGFLVSPTESIPAMIAEIKSKSDLYERLCATEQAFSDATSKSALELSEFEVKLNSEMAFYTDAYSHYTHTDVAVSDVITRLMADRVTYNDYIGDAKEYKEARDENERIRCDIDAFLERYPVKNGEACDDRRENLVLIRKNAEEYARISESLLKLTADIEAFESEYDMTEEPVDVAALQERQTEVDGRIGELHELIIRETEELSELSEEIRTIEEIEERIPDLMEDEARYNAEAELLEKSISYLAEAKERFLSKYMGPLRSAFRKYAMAVLPEQEAVIASDELELDMDLNVHLHSHGTTHSSEYLSAGYRDLVSLCARMALNDVLYDPDSPPLIMDDPFTDLDAGKLSRAKSLLSSSAANRQIIYMTCHNSRVL